MVAVGGSFLTTDDPAAAAREVTKAALELDEPKTRELTCQGKRQEQGLALGLAISLFQGPTVGIAFAGTDQLMFKTTLRSGDDADVLITGNLRYSFFGTTAAKEANASVRMHREGGRWKFCGISRAR